jgi:type II secretory pathway pseudopilin PulG
MGGAEVRHTASVRERKSGAGHTIIEIIVAMAIFLSVLTVVYAGFFMVRRNFHHQSANVEIRQRARVSIDNISQYLRMGAYVFENRTVTIQGVTYTVPAAGATGHSLVFAIPENGSAGAITYTVMGYYLKTRPVPDPANPNARQLMMYQKTNVTPPIADTPSSIDLAGLTGGSFRMIGDYYVRPEGLSFTLSSPTNTISIHLEVEKRDLSNMPLVEEELYTQVTLRNL